MALAYTSLNLPFNHLFSPYPRICIYSAAVTALAIQVSASVRQIPTRPVQKLTVDAQLAVPHHLLDLSLLLQVIQRLPRQTAIDLQSIDERGDGDEAVGLHVLVEFVRGGFVQDDGVVGLVLDYLPKKKKREKSARAQRQLL